MKHSIRHRKLNRTSSHRKALLMNLSNALFKHEQITTTLTKAKELRPFVEKIITLGKKGGLFNRRNIYSKLQDKNSSVKIINTLAKRYQKRNGGYSRIVRAGFRYGDNAPLAIIELVERDLEAKKIDIKRTDKEKKTEAGAKQVTQVKK